MKNNLKVIATTSDAYRHIIPIFCHLFSKYWPNQPVEIVGYTPPEKPLPENFTFHSMGKQVGSNKNFSNDLRKYFEKQDQWFIWLMEDSFVREPVNLLVLQEVLKLTSRPEVGRINLCAQGRSDFTIEVDPINIESVVEKSIDPIFNLFNQKLYPITREAYPRVYASASLHPHRLSTLPAIWNRDYLLRYLTADLNPWEFEVQPKVLDEFQNVCIDTPVIIHNEGVRKHDIHKYNFEGIEESVIEEMKGLGIL